MNLEPWLALARSLGPAYERGALDCPEAGLERTAQFLAARPWAASEEVHPWGLGGLGGLGGPGGPDSGALWEPWRRAREAVEHLTEGPQEPGARADYIVYDRGAASVTLGKVGLWRPGCARFATRACPRMAPMGHDSAQADCNYWSWPGMAKAAPGVELFPEWQRFDCHIHYPLFQLHLCGEALGSHLGARPRWVFHAPAEQGKALRAYAALTDRPDAFELEPLP